MREALTTKILDFHR